MDLNDVIETARAAARPRTALLYGLPHLLAAPHYRGLRSLDFSATGKFVLITQASP